MRRLTLPALLLLLFLPACAAMKNAERSRKLTVLAAREAASIADADARLTLQLNIANGALDRFEPEDGMAVISEVVKTLRSERDRLRGRTRLGGWVSASQLSRRAKNAAAAAEATRAAAQELDELGDQAERCQYLLGVAEEVRLSQGEPAAIALLSKGGGWATAIDNREERRRARLAFASALLELSAFDDALAVLRQEQDAAWASATLLALAATPETTAFATAEVSRPPRYGAEVVSQEVVTSTASRAESPESAPPPAPVRRPRPGYGKAVDFSSVFQNRASSAQ